MKKFFDSTKEIINKIPRQIRRVGLLLLIVLILATIVWKPIGVMNLQARAGRQIETFTESYVALYADFFTCQIPALTRLPEDPSLDQAVALLEKAQNLKPNNPQTYLLLGRAYCLQGDFSAAIAAFDEFSRIRKGNPLGAQETAFSHITMTLVPDLVPEEDVSAHEAAAEKILQSLGYSFEYFIDEADGAFDRGAHAAAWNWYRLAGLFQPLPEEAAQRVNFLNGLFID